MLKETIGLIGLTASLVGCASVYTLSPPTNPAYYGQVQGKSAMMADKENGIGLGVLDRNYRMGKDVLVSVYFLNTSTLPVIFGPENVRVRIDGMPQAIVPLQQILNETIASYQKRQNAAAVSGALNAASATNNAYRTESGQFNGTVNGKSFSGQYTGESYDPALAQRLKEAELQRTNAQLDQISQEGQAELQLIQEKMLSTRTVAPNTHVEGIVLIRPAYQPQDEGWMTVSVHANGGQHDYEFPYDRAR